MSPPDLTPTIDLTSIPAPPSTPPTISTPNQAATTTLHLTPTQASEIISTSLDLNAALKDLSHQLTRIRWAIEPLRDAISLAVDPLGIHIDARENETAEETRKRLDEGEGKRKGQNVHEVPKAPASQEEKTQVGKFHVASRPDIGSEMLGDFTGAWEADEWWGGCGSDHEERS
jgi:hypothetical protein